MKNIIIVVAIIVIVGGLAYAFSNNNQDSQTNNSSDQVTNTEGSKPMADKDELGESDQKEEENNEGSVTASSGTYQDYSPEALANAQGKDIVLFFHAGWCPTCKALERSINNNLSNIPEDLVILKVNYDNESDLKKKYAVVIQHTLVQVDSQGNEITKWTGGNDLESVINRLR